VAARIRAASRATAAVTGSTRTFGKWSKKSSTSPIAVDEAARIGRTSDSVTVMADRIAWFRPLAMKPSMIDVAAALAGSAPER